MWEMLGFECDEPYGFDIIPLYQLLFIIPIKFKKSLLLIQKLLESTKKS